MRSAFSLRFNFLLHFIFNFRMFVLGIKVASYEMANDAKLPIKTFTGLNEALIHFNSTRGDCTNIILIEIEAAKNEIDYIDGLRMEIGCTIMIVGKPIDENENFVHIIVRDSMLNINFKTNLTISKIDFSVVSSIKPCVFSINLGSSFHLEESAIRFSASSNLASFFSCSTCLLVTIISTNFSAENTFDISFFNLSGAGSLLLKDCNFTDFQQKSEGGTTFLFADDITNILIIMCRFRNINFGTLMRINDLKASMEFASCSLFNMTLETLLFVDDDKPITNFIKKSINLTALDITNLRQQSLATLYSEGFLILRSKLTEYQLNAISIWGNSMINSFINLYGTGKGTETLNISKLKSLGNTFSNLVSISGFENVLIETSLIRESNPRAFSNKLAGPAFYLRNIGSIAFINNSLFNNYAVRLNPGINIIQDEEFTQINTDKSVIVVIDSCLFSGNLLEPNLNSEAKSAALSFYFSGKIFLKNTYIEGNTIKALVQNENGPCIYSAFEETDIYIEQTYFINNTSKFSSNCIYFFGRHFAMSNSLLKNNRNYNNELLGYTFGGALSVGSDEAVLTNLSVIECSANNGAGLGVFVKRPFYYQNYLLVNVYISNSFALDKGGALFLQNYDYLSWIVLEVYDSDFSNNTSIKEGGLAYIHGILVVDSVIIFKRCGIFNNSGSRGGAVYNAVLNFESVYSYCNFSFNKATSIDGGGGVFFNGDTHTIRTLYCVSYNNFALHRGGFAQLLRGLYNDQGTSYYNCSAQSDGGAFVAHRDSEIYLKESQVEKGGTFVQGGFMMLMQNCKCSLYNLAVSNLKSNKGGFITIMQESWLLIDGAIITGVSSELGSIIYSLNTFTPISIYNLTVLNSSVSKTGIFYLLYSELSIASLRINISQGTIFHFSDSIIDITNAIVDKQVCEELNAFSGCLLNAEYSNINLTNGSYMNFILHGKKVLIHLQKQTSLAIFNASILEVEAVGNEPFIINCFSSSVNLTKLSLSKLFGFQAIFLNFQSSLVIAQASFNLMDSILSSTFIKCYNCINSSISNSNITGFVTSVNSLIHLEDTTINSTSAFTIKSSRFGGNKANLGGVIYLLNQGILLESSIFLSNTATFGGVIYMNCTFWAVAEFCQLKLVGNMFQQNIAIKAGGVLYTIMKKPLLDDNNKFDGNLGPDGDIYASNPVKIIFTKYPTSPKASGIPIDETYQFKLIDLFGQNCSYINGEFASIKIVEDDDNQNGNIKGSKVTRVIEGGFNFSELTIYSKPGEVLMLVVTTTAIMNFSTYLNQSLSTKSGDIYLNKTEQEFIEQSSLFFEELPHFNESGKYNFIFPQNIRLCIRGEIFKSSESVCYRCPIGLYSLKPEVEQCFECPINMICKGGDKMLAQDLYWQLNENSTEVYLCNILLKGCKGGEVYNQCNFGYTGVLCADCIFMEGTKFFKNTFAECSDCRDKNVFVPIILLIAFTFLIILQLLFTLKESLHITKKRLAITVSLLSNMFVNYIEMAGVVKNLMDSIPESLKQLINYSNMFLDLDRSTGIMNCMLGDLFNLDKSVLYEARQILVTTVLLVVFVLPLFFWVFAKLRYGKKYNPNTIVLITIIAMYKIMIQPLLKFFSNNFICFNIENKTFLQISPSIECYGPSHISTLLKIVLPGILILLVFPIFLMLRFVVKNRFRFEIPEISVKVWLIILGYKDDYYYWEYVLLVKKIILISTPIALSQDPKTSCLVLVFIMLASLMIHIKIKPYKTEKLNMLVLLQYIALYSIYASSLILLSTEDNFLRMSILGACALANLIFLVYWLRLTIQVYKLELREGGLLWRSFKSIRKLMLSLKDLPQTVILRKATSPNKGRKSKMSSGNSSK